MRATPQQESKPVAGFGVAIDWSCAVAMTMKEMADDMRAAGVKRARFSNHGELGLVEELELMDTIPAPPTFVELPSEPEEESKPAGICAARGCGEKNGWTIAPQFCRAHGLQAAGVRG